MNRWDVGICIAGVIAGFAVLNLNWADWLLMLFSWLMMGVCAYLSGETNQKKHNGEAP